jgi:hypothetical protein
MNNTSHIDNLGVTDYKRGENPCKWKKLKVTETLARERPVGTTCGYWKLKLSEREWNIIYF